MGILTECLVVFVCLMVTCAAGGSILSRRDKLGNQLDTLLQSQKRHGRGNEKRPDENLVEETEANSASDSEEIGHLSEDLSRERKHPFPVRDAIYRRRSENHETQPLKMNSHDEQSEETESTSEDENALPKGKTTMSWSDENPHSGEMESVSEEEKTSVKGVKHLSLRGQEAQSEETESRADENKHTGETESVSEEEKTSVKENKYLYLRGQEAQSEETESSSDNENENRNRTRPKSFESQEDHSNETGSASEIERKPLRQAPHLSSGITEPLSGERGSVSGEQRMFRRRTWPVFLRDQNAHSDEMQSLQEEDEGEEEEEEEADDEEESDDGEEDNMSLESTESLLARDQEEQSEDTKSSSVDDETTKKRGRSMFLADNARRFDRKLALPGASLRDVSKPLSKTSADRVVKRTGLLHIVASNCGMFGCADSDEDENEQDYYDLYHYNHEYDYYEPDYYYTYSGDYDDTGRRSVRKVGQSKERRGNRFDRGRRGENNPYFIASTSTEKRQTDNDVEKVGSSKRFQTSWEKRQSRTPPLIRKKMKDATPLSEKRSGRGESNSFYTPPYRKKVVNRKEIASPHQFDPEDLEDHEPDRVGLDLSIRQPVALYKKTANTESQSSLPRVRDMLKRGNLCGFVSCDSEKRNTRKVAGSSWRYRNRNRGRGPYRDKGRGRGRGRGRALGTNVF